MEKHFTLEYWIDDNWYIGRIKEIPSVFSQGETLEDLEENITDAYNMILKENSNNLLIHKEIKTKDFVVKI